MKEMLITTGATFVCALLFSLLFGRIALPILRSKKAGQPINIFAPPKHIEKGGTPTMGGIGFVPAFLVAVAAVMIFWAATARDRRLLSVALVVLFAVANAAIGFVDDYLKLFKKENEGLTSPQKFLLQTVVAAAFIAMMRITGEMNTVLEFPFTDYAVDLGFFAYPIYLVVLVGFINATNITDGLDGLSSSITVTVSAFMILFATLQGEPEVAVLAGALMGCVGGFLFFNRHPALMFMGDTGSLFLGAVIMGCATVAGELFLFVIAGFMFVIEMITSLIQIIAIRGFKRKVFRKAPLHHHFEMLDPAWSEIKIVVVFCLASVAFCALAFLGI